MSRATLGTINPATTSGTQLAALLSNRDAAENSGHAGTGRPSYATAGMIYTDDSFTPPKLFLASTSGTPDVDLTVLFAPPPGTLRATAAVRLETGWLWADGSAVARVTYPALFDAICPTFTGTVASGNATITGVSEDLRQLGLIGAKIEGLGVPGGATVLAISATTITLSANGTGAFASTPLRIYPHGNGNGSTTFNLPNVKGRVIFPRGDMGGTDVGLITVAGGAGFDGTKLGASGGSQAVVLTVAHLAAHNHPASSSAALVSGAGTASGSTDAIGNHTHTFSDTSTAAGAHAHAILARSNTGGVSGTEQRTTLTGGQGNLGSMNTDTEPAHTHTVSGTTSAAGTHSHTITAIAVTLTSLVLTVSTSVSNTGGDTGHPNVPPGIVENVVVKT